MDTAIDSFVDFAAHNWRLFDKNGVECAFELTPAQVLIDQAIERMRADGKPVRLRVLKYRQAGCSTYCTARMQYWAQVYKGFTALSLADKMDLPAQWLRRCKLWYGQLSPFCRPRLKASSAMEMYFDKMQSRYYIGSAEGVTPGMGLTIRGLHCSEMASWKNPEILLNDLLPAIPPGPETYVIQESTGRSFGDWWYKRYHEAKKDDCEYEALFLPWRIQPEYRDTDVSDLISLTSDEKLLQRAGLDREQLAWRRKILRGEFHGDEAKFANMFPMSEVEAFLSPGRQVFSRECVGKAERTVREPKWRGEILSGDDPSKFQLAGSPGGSLLIWADPDARYHYVIGADCQWGAKASADFDAAYVECLETGKVCAGMRGHWNMGMWAEKLASLGHLFNRAILAPERNTMAATGVVATLRGLTQAHWSYPNIWIRSKDYKALSHRPEDYGWWTDQHTKAEIIQMATEGSYRGEMDWADEIAVREMAAYIIDDEKLTMTAPEGEHDDCLMARMITRYVASRVLPYTDLYVKREPVVFKMRTMKERMEEIIDRPQEEEQAYSGF